MNYIMMNLKRLLKRKVNMIFLVVAPIILVFFASMMGNSTFDVKISYVDNDKTASSRMLIDRLERVGIAYEMPADEVDIYLINGDHDISINIEKGFEEMILAGKMPKTEVKSIQGAYIGFPVTTQIDNFVSSALMVSRSVNSDKPAYEKIMSDYAENQSGVIIKTTTNVELSKTVAKMSIGFLFFNMLLLASQSSSILVDDKKSKIFYRIFTGPISTFKYMFDNVISFFILMLIQIIVMMLMMFGVFGMYYDGSLLDLFLLFVVFGIVSVAFGVAINSLSRTRAQSSVLASLLITPMCMLGGFFWDLEMMPEFLRRVAAFLPTSWAIEGAVKLLNGSTFLDISTNILILLLFALGFFVLGALKKADISR